MTIEQRQTLSPIFTPMLLFPVRADSPRSIAELGSFARPVLAFRSGRGTGAPFGKEVRMTTVLARRTTPAQERIEREMSRHREVVRLVEEQAAGVDLTHPKKDWWPLVGLLIALTVAGLTVWAALALVLA